MSPQGIAVADEEIAMAPPMMMAPPHKGLGHVKDHLIAGRPIHLAPKVEMCAEPTTGRVFNVSQ